jgi:transposase InsO family protein
MRENSLTTKTLRARELGVSLRSLYYRPKKPDKDWHLKCRIEEVLREHPSYGSRRISQHLNMNRKPVKRVMNIFGIKAYRRRGKKWKKTKNIKVIYPNLLMTTYPAYPNHIWTADFTHFNFQGKVVYIATVMDLFTRRIVGLSVYTTHAVQLVLSALMNAIQYNPRPLIFHSDNGSEYNSEIFIEALANIGTLISRSAPGCPWENGYQESFHSQFKVDFGDPSRFKTLGELVYEIYQTIYHYNHTRIHSALKMPPQQFAVLAAKEYNSANKVSVQ